MRTIILIDANKRSFSEDLKCINKFENSLLCCSFKLENIRRIDFLTSRIKYTKQILFRRDISYGILTSKL